jgi:hypothetical protein
VSDVDAFLHSSPISWPGRGAVMGVEKNNAETNISHGVKVSLQASGNIVLVPIVVISSKTEQYMGERSKISEGYRCH